MFVEKIKDFDLIIFDRYRMRGILPMEYIDNVVQYVKNGGTVLVAAGPEFGAVDSLWRSPLAEILPVEPTSQVIEEGYKPALTDLGRRHPVTEGLEALFPKGWGRWFRLIDVNLLRGQVLMSGPQDKPLLVLDRVEQGRIAVLASDQAWLWGRGYEGGGPQLELLRRLAHWMLKEPELEEESLTATNKGEVLTITRRTVSETALPDLTITGPDGASQTLPLPQTGPGKFSARLESPRLRALSAATGRSGARGGRWPVCPEGICRNHCHRCRPCADRGDHAGRHRPDRSRPARHPHRARRPPRRRARLDRHHPARRVRDRRSAGHSAGAGLADAAACGGLGGCGVAGRRALQASGSMILRDCDANSRRISMAEVSSVVAIST